jgi:hypothetical protein
MLFVIPKYFARDLRFSKVVIMRSPYSLVDMHQHLEEYNASMLKV